MLKDLGWSSLENRRRDLRLTMLFKIIHGAAEVPTADVLSEADRRTRRTHDKKFNHLQTSSDPYKYSFFPDTIKEWNKLPAQTVTSGSVETFKSLLNHTK